jgi:hypothetical protein
MKKSEMIELLADLLAEQRKDLNNGSDSQDAENILSLLENAGMEPPYNNGDITYPNEWSEE